MRNSEASLVYKWRTKDICDLQMERSINFRTFVKKGWDWVVPDSSELGRLTQWVKPEGKILRSWRWKDHLRLERQVIACRFLWKQLDKFLSLLSHSLKLSESFLEESYGGTLTHHCGGITSVLPSHWLEVENERFNLMNVDGLGLQVLI